MVILTTYADVELETPIADIPEIVRGVRDGFRAGLLHSIERRENLLRDLYYAIDDNKELIYQAFGEDLNKSNHEAFLTEVSVALGEVGWLVDNVRRLAADTPVHDVPQSMHLMFPRIKKCPFGTVLIISPWNYPLMLSINALAAAIAAGNTVVFKPSEMSPSTARVMDKILQSVFDPETLATIQGGIPETTAVLDCKFDKIMYTGNGHVGRIIANAAAKNLTPCILELGGKSPVFVTAKANISIAAKRVAWGKWMNAGQTCVAPDYVLCHPDVHDEFVRKLGEYIKSFYPNLSRESQGFVHIVAQRHYNRLQDMLENTNGKWVQYGEPDEASRFFPPTVVTNVGPDDSLMKEELFGPILPIVKSDSVRGGVRFVQDEHDTPLALYIFTSDSREEKFILDNTRSGGVVRNDTLLHVGIGALPFGGIGESGYGNYHGEAGFKAFTHERAYLHTPTWLEPALGIRYPPLNDLKIKLVGALNGYYPHFSRTGPIHHSFIYRFFTKYIWIILLLAFAGTKARSYLQNK